MLAWRPTAGKKSEKAFYAQVLSKVLTAAASELLAATNFCGLAEKQIGKIVAFYGMEAIEAGDYSAGYPPGIGEQLLERFRERV